MTVGKKLVTDDKVYIQGNFDVGFAKKSTFKEELLEERLNRKKKIDEDDRKNGFPCSKGGGNNYR